MKETNDSLLDEAVKQIAENHRKIIDDWCKAYMAQLYEEGHDLKPGSFTLCEQEFGMYDGKYCKRYWFKKDVPQYEDVSFIKGIPEYDAD